MAIIKELRVAGEHGLTDLVGMKIMVHKDDCEYAGTIEAVSRTGGVFEIIPSFLPLFPFLKSIMFTEQGVGILVMDKVVDSVRQGGGTDSVKYYDSDVTVHIFDPRKPVTRPL